MPIEKASITTLRHTGDTYTVIPSSTISAIQSPEALAILAYLLDRPTDWTVRREDIMRRFGIGRDRHDKALRELKNLGLVWRENYRNETGQLIERRLCVCATPKHPLTYRATESGLRTENPPEGKSTRKENPPGGETDHLHNTELLHNTDKPVPAVVPTSAIPPEESTPEAEPGPRKMRPDWRPSERTVQRAAHLGYYVRDPEQILREFIDYWIHQGTRRKGWDRTFLNRLKAESQKQQGASYGQKTASDILADDLQRALAL